MTDDNSSMLINRATILRKLSTLMKHKCMVNVSLEGGAENATTIIIAIDEEANKIILTTIIVVDNDKDNGTAFLNFDASEHVNKKIITSPLIEFSTVFREIQVAFTAKSIKKIIYNDTNVSRMDIDTNALMIDIPSALYWRNRRKHYREKIPVVDSSFCEIQLHVPDKAASLKYKKNYRAALAHIQRKLLLENEGTPRADTGELSHLIRLSLHDVSLSGCSMLNCDKEFSYFLKPQDIYENCRIVMSNGSEINISFEIMTIRNLELPTGEFNELIGIKFLNIKRDAKP